MLITKIKLTNYRNHELLELKFNGQSFIIKGPNGIGKSNILEAIHLVSTTKSLRTKYDRDLINHNADVAHIEIVVKDQGSKPQLAFEEELMLSIQKSQTYPNASKKVVKINKVPKALRDFSGKIKSVLFTPDDLDILSGPPSDRRKYIDAIMFQSNESYKSAHLKYTKAIRHRNKILEKIAKTGHGHNLLPVWNEIILLNGEIIQKNRRELFEILGKKAQVYLEELDPQNSRLKINYLENHISEKRLEEYSQKEIIHSINTVGPHRDDFEVDYNNYNSAFFSSRGQQRTIMLAIKMAEMDHIAQATGIRPILLLDDIFSELDPKHKEAVMNITNLQQTIITTAIDSKNGLEIGAL